MTETSGLRLPLMLICRSLGESDAQTTIRANLMSLIRNKVSDIDQVDSTEVPCLKDYIDKISPVEPAFAQEMQDVLSRLSRA